jgi:hypothetical protein
MADTVDYVSAAYRHNPAYLFDQGVNYLDYFGTSAICYGGPWVGVFCIS